MRVPPFSRVKSTKGDHGRHLQLRRWLGHVTPDRLVTVEQLLLRPWSALEEVAEIELVARARRKQNAVAQGQEQRMHITSVANVGERAQAPVTCFVRGPWNAFMIGLNNSASGSAASRTAPTSSLTRATTSALSSPSRITAPSRSMMAWTASGPAVRA
jgi:hypothetical protein